MNKKEVIWREILQQTISNKIVEFTQKELAAKFGFSVSTVFNALKIPRQSGAIKVSGRNFSVADKEKFLNIWATFRNLKKDIIYSTHADLTVREIEGLMPDGALYGAFSAYAKKYQEAPADYDKVYVYADKKIASEIKERFSQKPGYQNIFIILKDSYLRDINGIIPEAQLYVDLWNLSDWYAKDFLNALKTRLFN